MERANSTNRQKRVPDLVLLRYAAQLAAAGLADPEILARAQPESVALLRMAAAAAEAGDPSFTANQAARARLCKDVHFAIDSIEKSASSGGAPAALQRSDSVGLLRQAAQAAEAAVKSATEALHNAGITLADDYSPRRTESSGMTSSQARLAARIAAYQKAAGAGSNDGKQPAAAAVVPLSPRLTSPRRAAAAAAAAAVHSSPRIAGSSSSSSSVVADRSRGPAPATAAHISRQTTNARVGRAAAVDAAAAAVSPHLAAYRNRSPVAAAAAAALAAAAAQSPAMQASHLEALPRSATRLRQPQAAASQQQQQQQQQHLPDSHGQPHLQHKQQIQQQQQQFEQHTNSNGWLSAASDSTHQHLPPPAAAAAATSLESSDYEEYLNDQDADDQNADDDTLEEIHQDPYPLSRQGTIDKSVLNLDGFFMEASPSSSVAGSSRGGHKSTSGGSSSSSGRLSSSSSGNDSICSSSSSSGGGWRGMLAQVPLPKSLFAATAARKHSTAAAEVAAAAAATGECNADDEHKKCTQNAQLCRVQQQQQQQQIRQQQQQCKPPAAEPAGLPRCSISEPDSSLAWQQQQAQQQQQFLQKQRHHHDHTQHQQHQQHHRHENDCNINQLDEGIAIFVSKQRMTVCTKAAAAAAAAAAPVPSSSSPSGIAPTSSIGSGSSSAKSSSTQRSWVQALIEQEQAAAAAREECSEQQQQQQWQQGRSMSPTSQGCGQSDLESSKRQQQLQQLQQLRKHRVAAVSAAHRQQQQQQQCEKAVSKCDDNAQRSSHPESPDGWRISSGLVAIDAQQQQQQLLLQQGRMAAAAAMLGSDIHALTADHIQKSNTTNKQNNMLVTSFNDTPNSDSKKPLLLTSFGSNTSSSTLGQQQQQQQPGSAKSNSTFKSSSGNSNASTESAFKREADRHWSSSSRIKRCLCILLPLLLAAVLAGGGVGAWAWHQNRKGSVTAAAAAAAGGPDLRFEVDIQAYATRDAHCGTWFATQSDIDAYQDTFISAYSSALNVTAKDISIDSITCNGSAVLGSSSSSSGKNSRLLLAAAADDQLLSSIKAAAAAAAAQATPPRRPGSMPDRNATLTNISQSNLVNISTSFTVAAAALGSSKERQAAVSQIVETKSDVILAQPMSELLGVPLAPGSRKAGSSSSSSGGSSTDHPKNSTTLPAAAAAAAKAPPAAAKAAAAAAVAKGSSLKPADGVKDKNNKDVTNSVGNTQSAESADDDSSYADIGGWDPETSWPAVWPPPAPKPSSSSSSSKAPAAAAAPSPPAPKGASSSKQPQKQPPSISSSSGGRDTQDVSYAAPVAIPEGSSSSSSDGSSTTDPAPITNIWLSWEAPSSGSETTPAMFSIQGKRTVTPEMMPTVPLPQPNSKFAEQLKRQQVLKKPAGDATADVRVQSQQQQQQQQQQPAGDKGTVKQTKVPKPVAAAVPVAAAESWEEPLPAVFPADQLDPSRYNTAPTCYFSPSSSNSISDSQGRLWGWMRGAACLFRSPTETSQYTSHPEVAAGEQTSLRRSQLTWKTAPACSRAPDGTTAVYDREGSLWGWEKGASCAFKSMSQAIHSKDRELQIETLSAVWENAPVCGMAPTIENTTPDSFGRFWGEDSSGSCAFRVDRA